MQRIFALFLTILPLAAQGQEAETAAVAAETAVADDTAGPAGTPADPLAAADVVLADLIFVKRPVIVFADTPNDPNFIRQMQLLQRDRGDLADRDAVVIVDTDPADATDVRRQFRPRGFSLVLVDKDGRAMRRLPLPAELREILNTIDRSPVRRQEMLERRPAGR
jgi:hypothetical protein